MAFVEKFSFFNRYVINHTDINKNPFILIYDKCLKFKV